MNIIFSQVDQNYIKAKVNSGFYSNATELVRDAVRRMRETDDLKYAHVMEALDLGLKDAREGRTVAYSPGLLEHIEKEAMNIALKDRKSDTGV
ncbi:MAG: hypothetical protein EB121_08660 [Alphaproteobacteria bacterium]|nr:hypothetical protein [Alphaproteobacteria bacterium]NDG05397.1 hypothetical protein [Alphaproteobacteria bacterium]